MSDVTTRSKSVLQIQVACQMQQGQNSRGKSVPRTTGQNRYFDTTTGIRSNITSYLFHHAGANQCPGPQVKTDNLTKPREINTIHRQSIPKPTPPPSDEPTSPPTGQPMPSSPTDQPELLSALPTAPLRTALSGVAVTFAAASIILVFVITTAPFFSFFFFPQCHSHLRHILHHHYHYHYRSFQCHSRLCHNLRRPCHHYRYRYRFPVSQPPLSHPPSSLPVPLPLFPVSATLATSSVILVITTATAFSRSKQINLTQQQASGRIYLHISSISPGQISVPDHRLKTDILTQ